MWNVVELRIRRALSRLAVIIEMKGVDMAYFICFLLFSCSIKTRDKNKTQSNVRLTNMKLK